VRFNSPSSKSILSALVVNFSRNENQFWSMKIILNLAIGRKFLAVTLFKAEVKRSFVLFSHRA
jgi:hypothetical protein